MKKIISMVVMAVLIITAMCSCNRGVGLGNLGFTHLHYDTHHENGCININKWYDSESGIEVKTGSTSMFFSEGTYILVEDETNCPFCH